MDCDAQENLDMRKMVDEWGWEWYGRYWAICGKVGMLVTEKQQTFALQTNNGCPFPVRLLANDLGTNVERLKEFCAYLSDNRLIDKKAWSEKGLIYMPKLKERADEYTKKLLTKSRHSPEQEVEEEVEQKEKKKEPKSVSAAPPVVIPSELNNPEFIEAWNEFKAMRAEIKKPLRGTAERTQLKKLSKIAPAIAVKMVEQSTANQWQGIFELKQGTDNGTGYRKNGANTGGITAAPGKYDKFMANRNATPDGNPKPIHGQNS